MQLAFHQPWSILNYLSRFILHMDLHKRFAFGGRFTVKVDNNPTDESWLEQDA